jgi:hypothetical protein
MRLRLGPERITDLNRRIHQNTSKNYNNLHANVLQSYLSFISQLSQQHPCENCCASISKDDPSA